MRAVRLDRRLYRNAPQERPYMGPRDLIQLKSSEFRVEGLENYSFVLSPALLVYLGIFLDILPGDLASRASLPIPCVSGATCAGENRRSLRQRDQPASGMRLRRQRKWPP